MTNATASRLREAAIAAQKKSRRRDDGGALRFGACYLLKFAFADKLALTVTVQVLTVPVQAPDQLAKVLPAGGVAVNVTAVPEAKFA